jgi:ubiquinone/menaquinone biosynthesis C-methylase UbiE
VISFLKKQKGKILDLGCGSGRNFVKEKEIYGIDFSQEMLKLAKNKATNKIKLFKSNSWKLRFPDNFFDSAICIALLHCVKGKNREKTINELYRVLKEKRKSLITVWARTGKFKNKEKESFVKWKDIGKRYNYFYDLRELEKELRKAGFKIIRSKEEIGKKAGNIIIEVQK